MLNDSRFYYYQGLMQHDYCKQTLKNISQSALTIIEKSKTNEVNLRHRDCFTCLLLVENSPKVFANFHSILINLRFVFCKLNNLENCSGFIGAQVTSTYNPRMFGTNGNYPSYSEYYENPSIINAYKNLRLQWLYFVANQCELYSHEKE